MTMTEASIFTGLIWPVLIADHPTCVTSPVIYVLGGQPGAGKSILHRLAMLETNDNLVNINGDEFRRYHPNYAQIQQRYGVNAAEHTAAFSGKITGLALDEARKEALNAVVEGTFRVANTPIHTLRSFKDAGYRTEVLIMTCPRAVSWTSTLSRYCALYDAGRPARYTPKHAHDLVVEQLAGNVQQVRDSSLVDRMRVYNRTQHLFDSQSHSTGKVDEAITRELHRPLTALEHQSVLLSYGQMQTVQKRQNAPDDEKQAITRGLCAYLLRSQDKAAIKKQPGLSAIQTSAEQQAKSDGKPFSLVIEEKAQQIEIGSLLLRASDNGLSR